MCVCMCLPVEAADAVGRLRVHAEAKVGLRSSLTAAVCLLSHQRLIAFDHSGDIAHCVAYVDDSKKERKQREQHHSRLHRGTDGGRCGGRKLTEEETGTIERGERGEGGAGREGEGVRVCACVHVCVQMYNREREEREKKRDETELSISHHTSFNFPKLSTPDQDRHGVYTNVTVRGERRERRKWIPFRLDRPGHEGRRDGKKEKKTKISANTQLCGRCDLHQRC